MTETQTPAYTATARFLHWLTAACVLSMIPAGLAMLRISGGPMQNFLFDFHRSMGVVLFVITVVRLIHRINHRPAPLPAGMPMIQKFAAHAVHTVLYVILLASPIVGWIGTSAFGAPIKVFWTVTLPPIVAKDKATADLFLGLHQYLGWIMTAAVLMHIGAALYHQFVVRDDLISRMVRG
ncbi:cytochrome b [Breoghania sp. L-A4]|uniref:cytochrome b n=1 Tax=Breoghania sp. L-A4 TaxID=2304600 RepID=UPI000E360B72|nr:cytochrome b [Breoghania sp. L-A4]AXS39341.1 cytochrome b [Breoghania sp. L-A4]